ncbi:MAG: glycoside hydrolase [Anaerolineae bacterium]|jgi:hypothetical protein|nr:glycoside hydrolase [Anaerolineae bacterium]
MTSKHLHSQHGIICRLADDPRGYFGWPSVTRTEDGALLVVSSGLRSEHVCPWGKTVLNASRDDGRTWTIPQVINDSPIDDRDAGILSLGDGKLLASWFTSDTRKWAVDGRRRGWLNEENDAAWQATLATWTDELVDHHLGSWVMLSGDAGANWEPPIRVPVTAPHGPVLLQSGDLIYFGKEYITDWSQRGKGAIMAARSSDGGRTWTAQGAVPLYAGSVEANYHEPHAVELPSGKLLGVIRVQSFGPDADVTKLGLVDFSMAQTESTDGGHTWTSAQPMGFHGSPPHLLRHSSGALVLTYGYRLAPFGQRVALSWDDGANWDHDWIIRDDGPDGDLGYPATVELSDGSLFTVYYQKVAEDRKCSLLWSRWQLP